MVLRWSRGFGALMYALRHSVVWRTTALLLCSTCVVWLAFSIVLVWQSNRMTHDVLAQQQIQFTTMLWENLGDEDDLRANHVHSFGAESGLEFALYDRATGELLNASSAPALPMQSLSDGSLTPKIQSLNRQDWLVSIRENTRMQLIVASPVQQTTKLAHELAERMGVLALFGLLLLCPVLYWALRRGFAPMVSFSDEVATRAVTNLAPIGGELPLEMRPLQERLNALFTQVVSTMAREQRFTADAAHELRTPLTAVGLQLELAQHSPRIEVREKALMHSIAAVKRATHVVNQLLLLARLEHGDNPPTERVSMADVVFDAFDAAGLPTDAVHLNVKNDVSLLGQPVLLGVLLRNLLDNAVRYGQNEAGLVEVFAVLDSDCLILYDTGKGISTEQQARLGERFYRDAGQAVSGAGLGWSIVQRIAMMHGVECEIFNAKPSGFGVKMVFNQNLLKEDL